MACGPDTSTPADTTADSVAELSDDRLIARVAERDQEAFAGLLGRHLDAIHGYLYRLTGSQADADDLSQETFLRVWQKASTFKQGRVKLSTWLHRIAHNLCVDEFRKRRPIGEVEPDQLAASNPGQETGLALQQSTAQLKAALQGLPESQRSALVLCQLQGFSNQEAAEILGIGVRALESLLARARRRLKNELCEHIS